MRHSWVIFHPRPVFQFSPEKMAASCLFLVLPKNCMCFIALIDPDAFLGFVKSSIDVICIEEQTAISENWHTINSTTKNGAPKLPCRKLSSFSFQEYLQLIFASIGCFRARSCAMSSCSQRWPPASARLSHAPLLPSRKLTLCRLPRSSPGMGQYQLWTLIVRRLLWPPSILRCSNISCTICRYGQLDSCTSFVCTGRRKRTIPKFHEPPSNGRIWNEMSKVQDQGGPLLPNSSEKACG